MGKRLISLLLAVVLVLSLAGLPAAFAVEGDGDTTSTETTVTDETEDTATQAASADDSSSGSENAVLSETETETEDEDADDALSDEVTDETDEITGESEESVEETTDVTTQETAEEYTVSLQSANDGTAVAASDDGISLATDYTGYTVAVGDQLTISGTSGNNHSWTITSGSSYATLTSSGATAYVTGVAAGTVTITHSYKSGWSNNTDTYTVTVTDSGSSGGDTETYITVYLYVKVDGDTDVDWSTWNVNESGWYTIGSIQIPTSILSSDVNTSHTIEYTFSDADLAAVVSYVTSNPDSISLYGQNVITTDQIVSSINWSAFKLCNGADNYVSSGTAAYHLDGYLTISSKAVTHTLIYDANAGTDTVTKMPNPSTETVEDYYTTHNFAITDAVPEREGYAFVKWNTEPDGSGQSYAYGDTITVAETETLYAIWVKTVSLTVTKVVNGTTADTTKEFTFTVVYGDETTDVFTLSNGESYDEFLVTDLTVGSTVTLTESNNDDYNVTVSYNEQNVTQSANGSFTFTLVEGADTVTVTNTPKTTTITITKDVTGNMGDTTKEFDFTLTLTDYTEDLSATKYDSSADSTENVTLASGSSGYSFTLADDDCITITVPVGYAYTVAEKDYKTSDGYTTTTSGSALTGRTTSNGVSIAYTNDKTVTPDTGVTLSTLPFVLILTASLSGLGLVVINRKRRDSDG